MSDWIPSVYHLSLDETAELRELLAERREAKSRAEREREALAQEEKPLPSEVCAWWIDAARRGETLVIPERIHGLTQYKTLIIVRKCKLLNPDRTTWLGEQRQ